MNRACVLVLMITPLLARGEAVLSAATTHVAESGAVNLRLTLTNPAHEPLHVILPARVRVRLENDSSVAMLDAALDRAGEINVAPHSFQTVTLTATLPMGMHGPATIQLPGIESNSILLQVTPRSVPPRQAASSQATPPAFDPDVVDKPPPLAVTTYDPVYVLVGGDGGLNARFQISLRYRLFDGNGKLARRLPWIDDLYLAYSQTSLWDLGEISKPFRDSSYRPRLFYAQDDLWRFADGSLRLSVETGIGHESNGREGENSRSFNMLYVRPALTWGEPDGFRMYVAPLLHNYIAADENPDIGQYRGYIDWQLGIGSKGGLDLSAMMRKGTRSDYGSVELNLTYPLRKLSDGDLTGWLMVQYFGGYGESLLEYRRKLDSQFRVGIAIAL